MPGPPRRAKGRETRETREGAGRGLGRWTVALLLLKHLATSIARAESVRVGSGGRVRHLGSDTERWLVDCCRATGPGSSSVILRKLFSWRLCLRPDANGMRSRRRPRVRAALGVDGVSALGPGHLRLPTTSPRRMPLRTLLRPLPSPAPLASRLSRMASNDNSIEVRALPASRKNRVLSPAAADLVDGVLAPCPSFHLGRCQALLKQFQDPHSPFHLPPGVRGPADENDIIPSYTVPRPAAGGDLATPAHDPSAPVKSDRPLPFWLPSIDRSESRRSVLEEVKKAGYDISRTIEWPIAWVRRCS